MRPLAMGGLPVLARAVSSPWIALQDVEVRFGAVSALQGVSLTVAPGERIALVGPNGSGKSTLLRLLHGLVPAGRGTVARDPALRQAMLFQRPHMLRMNAGQQVALGLWLRGQPWREARAAALQALARAGLAEVAQRSARTLSGGQQQRLAFAGALAQRPDLLLLDEPTASLDPHAKREVEALIGSLAEGAPGRAPMTWVMASHNLGQVKRLASRVLYLEHGRLLADLPVDRFFDRTLVQAAHPELHLFLKGELP